MHLLGTTNNVVRRLEQQNGELSGGARYTTAYNKHGTWTIFILVKGFSSQRDCLQFERRMKRTKGVQTTNSYERRLSILAIVTRTWMYELQVKTNFATELDAMRFAAEVVPWQPPDDGASAVHPAAPTKPQPSLTLPCPQPLSMTDASVTDESACTPKVLVANKTTGIRVVSYSLFWGAPKG